MQRRQQGGEHAGVLDNQPEAFFNLFVYGYFAFIQQRFSTLSRLRFCVGVVGQLAAHVFGNRHTFVFYLSSRLPVVFFDGVRHGFTVRHKPGELARLHRLAQGYGVRGFAQ